MKQEKRLPLTVARQPVSGKPLTLLAVAAIVLLALCLTGCAPHRKIARVENAEQVAAIIRTDSVSRLSIDSVSEVVEVRTQTVNVPMSAVSLTIATDSLRSLPQGASYSGRSGQASVKVSRKAATATEPEYIYVYASCDSLALQCERYERTIRNLHKDYGERLREMQGRMAATSQEEVHEKPPNAIGTALKWYFFGLLSGVLATSIIFIKLKK